MSAQSIDVDLVLPPREIAFGDVFEIAVTRTLPLGTTPDPIDERALGPFLVLGRGVDFRIYGTKDRKERLRFRVRCFAAGEVKVGPLTMRCRDGERETTVSSRQVVVNVKSCLPEPPGAFEWPGDLRDLPAPPPWPWLVAAVAGLTACVWWWRRPRAVGERAIAVVQPAAPTALRELRALVVPGDGDDAAAVVAFHQHVKRLLRQHCRERFAIAADVCTSEELLRAVPPNAHVAPCLVACDLVLFAAVLPPVDERARTLAAAIAFAGGTS